MTVNRLEVSVKTTRGTWVFGSFVVLAIPLMTWFLHKDIDNTRVRNEQYAEVRRQLNEQIARYYELRDEIWKHCPPCPCTMSTTKP